MQPDAEHRAHRTPRQDLPVQAGLYAHETGDTSLALEFGEKGRQERRQFAVILQNQRVRFAVRDHPLPDPLVAGTGRNLGCGKVEPSLVERMRPQVGRRHVGRRQRAEKLDRQTDRLELRFHIGAPVGAAVKIDAVYTQKEKLSPFVSTCR
jgi:hypothetical protein